jgi:hypothetical protein
MKIKNRRRKLPHKIRTGRELIKEADLGEPHIRVPD